MIIGAAELERAEKTLQVVYGGQIDRQLEALRIDRDAWNNFLEANQEVLQRNYREAYQNLDPRLIPAFNTLMTHCLFVGVVAGSNQARQII